MNGWCSRTHTICVELFCAYSVCARARVVTSLIGRACNGMESMVVGTLKLSTHVQVSLCIIEVVLW
jgi:hypothetical protein